MVQHIVLLHWTTNNKLRYSSVKKSVLVKHAYVQHGSKNKTEKDGVKGLPMFDLTNVVN